MKCPLCDIEFDLTNTRCGRCGFYYPIDCELSIEKCASMYAETLGYREFELEYKLCGLIDNFVESLPDWLKRLWRWYYE